MADAYLHADGGDLDDEDIGFDRSPTDKKGKRKRDAAAQLRKNPNAPKRFKSSYICFFMAKQSEIKEELGDKANVTSISKRSAEMWKNLPPEERAHWDDVAAKDKQRFMVEKATWQGPWQVPWKRAKKDPTMPKRPPSAFLLYSLGKRSKIKAEHPELKNTDVSRILGEMWRNASEEERRPHVEQEKAEREEYHIAVSKWRKENEERLQNERKQQSEHALIMGDQMGTPMYPSDQFGQPPPYMYGQPYPYPYPPPGPYQFPTNGKQPVVLGPSGTPVYPAQYTNPALPPPAQPSASPHEQPQQSPTSPSFAQGTEYDENDHAYDYSDPADGEPQT